MKHIAQSTFALCARLRFALAALTVHGCNRNITFDVPALHVRISPAKIFIGPRFAFSCASPTLLETGS